MYPDCINADIAWARNIVDVQQKVVVDKLLEKAPAGWHWSRLFEFSWVLAKGDFSAGQWVLDAAGGASLFQKLLSSMDVQVVNVDLVPGFPGGAWEYKIAMLAADLHSLPFKNNMFDRVVCISALEDMLRPSKVLGEMWRVLKPGGRLLVTMDISDMPRWNHRVDINIASKIVSNLGLTIPPLPEDALLGGYKAFDRDEGESEDVRLRVICFTAQKAYVASKS